MHGRGNDQKVHLGEKVRDIRKNNRIGINYIYNLSYQILSMVIPLLTTPYLSRVLASENIGVYSYVNSVTAYFTLFASFGFHVYAQRKIAFSQNDKSRVANVFYEVMLDKVIFTGIALFAYIVLIFLNTADYRAYFAASGILVISVFFDISWLFQGLENFRMIFFRSLVLKLSALAFIFLFVKRREDLLIYILAEAMANLLGNLSMLPSAIRYFKGTEVKVNDLLPGIKTSAELFVPMIAIYLYSLADRTMLGLTGNRSESGVYEQAHKILRLLEMVPVSLSTVLIPRISFVYKNESEEKLKKSIDKAYQFVIFLGMPISFGLFAAADNLVPWFFGDGYEKVAMLLKMSAPIVLVIGMANIAGNAVLIPIEEHNKTTAAAITGAVVNIILNSFWIGIYFSTGAMVASIIAESIVCIMEMFFARKYFSIKNILKYLLESMLVSLVMYFAILAAAKLSGFSGFLLTFTQTAVGAAVYGIVLLAAVKAARAMKSA